MGQNAAGSPVAGGSTRAIEGGALQWPTGLSSSGSPLLLEVFDETDRKTYFANLGVSYLKFRDELSQAPQTWRLDENWTKFHVPSHRYRFNVTAALPLYGGWSGNVANYGVLATAGRNGKAADFNNTTNRVNGAINKFRANISYLNQILADNPAAQVSSAVVGGGLDQSWDVRRWDLLGEPRRSSLFLNESSSAENLDTDSSFFYIAFDPKRTDLPRRIGTFRLNTADGTLVFTPSPLRPAPAGAGATR